MLRLTTRLLRHFSLNPLPKGPHDLSNSLTYLTSPDKPTLTFVQKLLHFTPGNLYHGLDQFSREILFTFANDYRLGLPAAVIIISFILRGVFFYPNVKGQIAALKMKEIKPYMEKFQEKARLAQMTRNMALMKSAKAEFKDIQKKKGIDNFYVFVNVLQIPFLITWFLSLRYVAALPEVFPSVTQSFLWMSDLSTYDPYFILPLTSAMLTSYSIIVSPGLKNANVMPILEPFVKYFKYLPFLSLPITGFFPAILNIYWCALAMNQAILMTVMNADWMKKHITTETVAPKSQIRQAVFVEEKQKPKIALESENKISVTPPQPQKVTPELQTAQKLQILSKKPKKGKKPSQ